MGRRIIRINGDGISVAREARLDSEATLHHAVAAHPEVLPAADFGLGPLISLATELDFFSGPMDLLTADAQGHLAIIEFKRGSENPDVRQVVAQMLDYGASLWRQGYDALEARCRSSAPGFTGSLAKHVHERLGALEEEFDEEVFQRGIELSLDSGAFAFVYCGRDLDDRTRRIMTYLAEGPRMNVFAVEVDYYVEGTNEEAVLVPRAAFVPSWVTGPASAGPRGSVSQSAVLEASPEFHELVERMDEVARDLGLDVIRRRTGWMYRPAVLEEGVPDVRPGIGVYASSRGVEFMLSVLRDLGQSAVADAILGRLEALTGRSLQASRDWPHVPCASLLQDWPRARREVIEPYFRARGQAPSDSAES